MRRSTTLVLFGANSLCGEALLEQLPADAELLCLSRRSPASSGAWRWRRCDLEDLSPAELLAVAGTLPSGPQVWICFAHIWLLAPFLDALALHHPEALAGLKGVVACSSSSVITKRFAFNRFDRELVARLTGSQQRLESACERLGVPCRILAPTLIHGRSAHHADRNVEALRHLLCSVPLLPLPAQTGLHQADEMVSRAKAFPPSEPALLPLGGDETLSYRALLERIQAGDPPAARCRLLTLPTSLFQWLASPLLLASPKTFEAVLRLSADLAGFARVADLLGRPPQLLEVQPPCPR